MVRRSHKDKRYSTTMTKGKKTTQQERAEIVAFCLEHGKDYLLTVEQFGVSYLAIQYLHDIRKYPVSKLRTALHIPRCSYYKWLKREKNSNVFAFTDVE